VLNRLAQAIEADGFLMLGAAETAFGLTNKPMAERHAVYRPNEVCAASVRTAAFVAPAPRGDCNGGDLMTENGKSVERVTFSRI
jgi:hypothetical protein